MFYFLSGMLHVVLIIQASINMEPKITFDSLERKEPHSFRLRLVDGRQHATSLD